MCQFIKFWKERWEVGCKGGGGLERGGGVEEIEKGKEENIKKKKARERG